MTPASTSWRASVVERRGVERREPVELGVFVPLTRQQRVAAADQVARHRRRRRRTGAGPTTGSCRRSRRRAPRAATAATKIFWLLAGITTVPGFRSPTSVPSSDTATHERSSTAPSNGATAVRKAPRVEVARQHRADAPERQQPVGRDASRRLRRAGAEATSRGTARRRDRIGLGSARPAPHAPHHGMPGSSRGSSTATTGCSRRRRRGGSDVARRSWSDRAGGRGTSHRAPATARSPLGYVTTPALRTVAGPGLSGSATASSVAVRIGLPVAATDLAAMPRRTGGPDARGTRRSARVRGRGRTAPRA